MTRLICTLSLVLIFANKLITQCNTSFSLGNDTIICKGRELILNAGSQFDTYRWQNGSNTQLFNATETGLYSCMVSQVELDHNLVINGDFELGNNHFTSDYTFLPIDDVTGPNGVYGVINNPNTWFSPFAACPDHTTGTGNMMVIDGSVVNGGNDAVWCQTVPVAPNTNYIFHYWAQSVTGAPFADLRVEINGLVLGSNLVPDRICGWEQTTYNWNSGTSDTAQICIYNNELAGFGNDFTLDDIGLYQICEYFDDILVTVLAPDTLMRTDTICEGERIFLEGGWQQTAGLYYDVIDTASCLQVVETRLVVKPSPEASAPANTAIRAGEMLEVVADSTLPGTHYEWTSSNGHVEMRSRFLARPLTTTVYFLSVERDACIDSDTFQITVFQPGIEIIVPTGFSPNNDNINDVFSILNAEEFEAIEMRIFNRWGEMIFFSTDKNPVWNGMYKGTRLPIGSYVYTIEAFSPNLGATLFKSETISLIR